MFFFYSRCSVYSVLVQLWAQSLLKQLQTEKVQFKNDGDTKHPGEQGHTDAWQVSCVHMCGSMCVCVCVFDIRNTAEASLQFMTLSRQKQRGVTQTGNEHSVAKQETAVDVVTGALTTHGLSPHKLSVSHTDYAGRRIYWPSHGY